MLGLIPRDYWEHNIGDLLRGMAAALVQGRPSVLIDIPGLGKCIPVRSGRAALVAAIKSLDLLPDARVAVPLFCCPVVFKAVTAAGCKPVFIDIDPTTFCMSADDLRKKSPQVNAVIAVYMFGNLCDTPGLQEAIGDKPIIEDCAQSLGSKLNGRMAGSFGTMAVFSFKSGKYLSVGEGGALFTRNTELQARLTRYISEMPVPGRKEELKHVATTYIKSALRSKPLYGVAGYHLWKSFNKKMNLSEKSGVVLSQILRSDLAVACKRFSLLDSLIEAQRANAGFYSRSLELDPGMLCTERPGAFYNRYHFPITFPSQEHRDFIADYLLKRGIDSMKYLDDIVGVAVKHYGYPGDCPTAEFLSKRVLVIPGYYSLGKNEIHRIVNSINSGWAEVTGTRKS